MSTHHNLHAVEENAITGSVSSSFTSSPLIISSLSFNIFQQPESLFETINNSSSTYNKFNDSAVCHPLLLALGNKSEKGLCDDMTSSTVISAIVLAIHTIIVIVSIGGLVYKLRKLHVLKREQKQVVNYLQVARNPLLMIIGALIGWGYTFMLMGRVLIGRKFYPCFIFSLVYYIAVPALSNTVLMRCIRLLILTKLNELKVKIGRRQYDLHSTLSSENMKPMIEENTNISQNQQNQVVLDKELDTISTTRDDISVSNSSITGHQHSSSLSALTTGRNSSILSQFVIEPKESNAEDNLEDEMIFRKETLLESFERGKLLTIMRFLVSTKFVLLSYVVVIGFHLTIYFIIAITDYFNYQKDTSVNTNQKRNSFTIDSYLFSPSGCGVGAYNQYIFITYFCFYGLLGILLTIVAFFAKRDVWNIKIEVAVINLFWAAIVLAFSIPSLFTIITTYVDYYFPWTITILVGCMWDTLISLSYPVFVLQRFKSEKSTSNNTDPIQSNNPSVSSSYILTGESNIRKILLNERWNNLFLKFSEKSFSCEDVMMWNAIEKFRTIKSEKQRRELFYNICNTYIRIGAPLELNIPRKDFGIPEIMEIYQALKESNINFASKNGNASPKVVSNININNPPSTTKSINTTVGNSPNNLLFSITPEIFNKIQTACEHNMLDNYTRFQTAYEKPLENELEITPKLKV